MILVLLLKIISAENDSVAIPVFKNCAEYGKHIDEELEVGSIVMQVSATVENVVDVDIEYALLSNDRFKIDAKSGQITTNYNFDRDEPRNEKLELITVIASHTQNMLEFLGTCEFEIIIDDINDNSPIFQQTHYQSSVMINSKLNDIIFKVEATDIDEGINSKLTYATDSHTFSIDDNGIIFLEVIVDKKVGDIYNFTVTAYSGKKQTNSLISLTVVSENPSTVTQSSQVTNVQTTVKISSSSNDPNADKDEDNEGETQNNLAKKDETTVKNSLLSNDPNAGKDKENEGGNHKTPPQNSQTTNDQTTVKNSLLLNDPDAKADEVNKDQTLTIVNQPIDEASLLPNITDTEGDKINDVFMNETITSDDTKINMKKTIVGFLIKDYNLIAILAIIIIIMINILVCRCCFCRSKRISHDFTSTDNSLYFFGSEKRDSFGMIETKAMNDYGNYIHV